MLRSYKSDDSSYYNPDSRTPMDEYLERITRMQRTPTMITDYPHFPNVHEILKNNSTDVEKHEDRQEKISQMNHLKNQNPEACKKVHIVEQEKNTEAGRDGKIEVFQGKMIDVQAEGFIKWNHKNFELCKWDTFKG